MQRPDLESLLVSLGPSDWLAKVAVKRDDIGLAIAWAFDLEARLTERDKQLAEEKRQSVSLDQLCLKTVAEHQAEITAMRESAKVMVEALEAHLRHRDGRYVMTTNALEAAKKAGLTT